MLYFFFFIIIIISEEFCCTANMRMDSNTNLQVIKWVIGKR